MVRWLACTLRSEATTCPLFPSALLSTLLSEWWGSIQIIFFYLLFICILQFILYWIDLNEEQFRAYIATSGLLSLKGYVEVHITAVMRLDTLHWFFLFSIIILKSMDTFFTYKMLYILCFDNDENHIRKNKWRENFFSLWLSKYSF